MVEHIFSGSVDHLGQLLIFFNRSVAVSEVSLSVMQGAELLLLTEPSGRVGMHDSVE
jgi:hypothetical protein